MFVVTRVCVSVRGRMPTLLHGPGGNLGEWYGMPPSCALLGDLHIVKYTDSTASCAKTAEPIEVIDRILGVG